MNVKFKNLRGEMAKAGFTQKSLADAIGKTESTVGYKLRGDVAWTLKEMELIQRTINEKAGANYTLDFLFEE